MLNPKITQLIHNMALFRKQYHIYVTKRLENLNISNSEFSYLRELVNNDGICHEIIVKNTCVDKAASSRVAKSLEEKGIIYKKKNETDKRGFLIYLTDEGKKYVSIVNTINSDWYNILCNTSDVESVEKLNSLLEEVNKW